MGSACRTRAEDALTEHGDKSASDALKASMGPTTCDAVECVQGTGRAQAERALIAYGQKLILSINEITSGGCVQDPDFRGCIDSMVARARQMLAKHLWDHLRRCRVQANA